MRETETAARPAREPTRPIRPWQALRNYNYRLFFFGQLVSQSGGWIQRVGQAWLVLDLTGSPLALGTVASLQFLPILFFSLISGVIADRLPKRGLLMVVQAVAMAQALILAALVLTQTVQLWHVYALALLLGLATSVEAPTRQAFAGEMVHRQDLASAVGLNSSVFNAARILGPGIGGVVIAFWGVGWCFLLNGLSYLAVMLALATMRTGGLRPAPRIARAPLWTQLADGLRYAARTPELAFPLVILAVIGTFGYNFGVALPLLARYALDVGAVGFGNMNAAMGIGSLIGAIGVAARAAPSTRVLLVTAAGFSLLLLGVALVPWYLAALGLLVVLGLAGITYTASTNTSLQLTSREEYRGRVLSLYTLLFAGTTPIGAAITGVLADAWGIRAAMAIEAGVCMVGVGIGFLYWKVRVR